MLLAWHRSSLTALMHLAKTASATVGAGMPISKAFTDVHFPVPFWPAVSKTESTKKPSPEGSFC